MTAANLKDKRVRDLAQMAKKSGVPGWHAMRKDQLIDALVCRAKKAQAEAVNKRQECRVQAHHAVRDIEGKSEVTAQPPSSMKKDLSSLEITPASIRRLNNPTKEDNLVDRKAIVQRVRELQAKQTQEKSLATKQEPHLKHHSKRNRLVVLVRGPHWLHVFWEITEPTIKRVQASMGEQWHTAKPILRLLESPENREDNDVESVIREIEIHGGVKNWFIDLRQPIACRVEIGYKSRCGNFHRLCRSNRVSAAPPNRKDSLNVHWKDIENDGSRIFSLSGGYTKLDGAKNVRDLFQERLSQPLVPLKTSQQAVAHTDAMSCPKGFPLEIEAEILILGATEKGAQIFIQGEPLHVADDGTFHIRIDMPNQRQVIPISAQSASGLEQQTIVVAVERNTRLLEPQPINETDDL